MFVDSAEQRYIRTYIPARQMISYPDNFEIARGTEIGLACRVNTRPTLIVMGIELNG